MAEARIHHRVQWGETDAAGIVFYPNYFRWFDQGVHEIFRAAGFSVAAMRERGYSIPLIEAGARFRAALEYDTEVVIESRVSEVRSRSFRVDHVVRRGEEIALEGHDVRIWARLLPDVGVDAERIPLEMRRLIEPA